jgi:murein DD-endopeptidase MepM/ murein hydrolase activator NlpD
MIYPDQILKVSGSQTSYTVQSVDSMWSISQKFNVDLEVLKKANPQIKNFNNIWSGLKVFIPDNVNSNTTNAAKPDKFVDGLFPIVKGTYKTPVLNNYSDNRTWTPSGENNRKHEGVDIIADKGTPIYSAMDGEIINFGWNQFGGWRITVRVDDSTVFYYAHLSKYPDGIGKGSKIKKGQLIGFVGNTGYGPEGTEGQFVSHLHFGIYKTDAPSWYTIDPYSYLKWWESKL